MLCLVAVSRVYVRECVSPCRVCVCVCACLQLLNDSVAWLRSGDLLYWCRVAECARWKPPVKDWHVGTTLRRVSPSSVTFLWISLSLTPRTFTLPPLTVTHFHVFHSPGRLNSLGPSRPFSPPLAETPPFRPSFQRFCNPQVNPHFSRTPLPPRHLLLRPPPLPSCLSSFSTCSCSVLCALFITSSLSQRTTSPRRQIHITHIRLSFVNSNPGRVLFRKGTCLFFSPLSFLLPDNKWDEECSHEAGMTMKVDKPNETFHKFAGFVPHIQTESKCVRALLLPFEPRSDSLRLPIAIQGVNRRVAPFGGRPRYSAAFNWTSNLAECL